MFEDEKQNKVIFLDYGLFLHRSLFGWESQRIRNGGKNDIPATYLCLNSMITSLSNIGIGINDTVIVAIDGRGNWRKDIDPNYKANRKDLKKKDAINWLEWYKKFDDLIEKLKKSTPWHCIGPIPKLEADDIIAVGVRFYKDTECIIISSDSDFEQLCALKNVKIYSPVSKQFKIIENPYKSLADKIKKEATDNLLSPILDEADFERRRMIVNLLSLPENVEKKILDEFEKLSYNSYDLEKLPFKSLQVKYMNMFNSKNVVTLEKSIKKKVKKKKTLKKRKEENKNVQDNPKIPEW